MGAGAHPGRRHARIFLCRNPFDDASRETPGTTQDMTPSAQSVISVQFKGFLGKFKLDVNFETPMHGVTALFGPSGSGKTTILRCVAGLTRLPGHLVVGREVWQNESEFRVPHQR